MDNDIRYEPFVVHTPFGDVKFCALTDICRQPLFARGLCQGHWKRLKDGRELGKIWKHHGYPDCTFEGCPRLAQSKRGGLCPSHYRLELQGEELRLLEERNLRFTTVGRECKTCGEDKPLTEFYNRNSHQNASKPSKSTQCKLCYSKDISYYQGKSPVKSDGSDPLGYATTPGLMEERYEKTKSYNLARWQRDQAKKKAAQES